MLRNVHKKKKSYATVLFDVGIFVLLCDVFDVPIIQSQKAATTHLESGQLQPLSMHGSITIYRISGRKGLTGHI